MSWTVDMPVQVGDTVIAAIVDFNVSVRAFGSTLSGRAQKEPLLVLQFRAGRISGLDMKGHAYDADEIELLYPTAIAQIRATLPG
ncbi:hypothetical protein [uncultured Tateyamaria sp.]|uniref:hypothetical protein n=1 Tax=uncultured Tateyamaria sp. TaxID=455651 RepID=UPI0026283751|nr:hypothetical protein [uncultured Tateyamaria sp.]